MKKRLLALMLCLVLAAGLAVPVARAEDNVFFTAMGESILPLTDETMPFLSGSNIYIPVSIFTGTVRKNLDISSTYNKTQKLVILYRGSQSLWFDLGKDYGRDNEDNIYYPGAIVKGEEVFVSASLVARFFDLSYSITEVPHGYMVWFRKAGYPLSDIRFADAASYSMESRYADYLKTKAAQQVEQPPQEPLPQDPEMDGKSIYLGLSASLNLTSTLDTLENAAVQGAVFFRPEEMAEAGGLLRRCAVKGHSIGILADASLEEPVTEQVLRANRALEEATCGRTRLVRLENPTEQSVEALQEAGYCVVRFDLDRSQSGLRSAAQAENLVTTLSKRSGSARVWLGESLSSVGLRTFLRQVKEADGRCRALTETSGTVR